MHCCRPGRAARMIRAGPGLQSGKAGGSPDHRAGLARRDIECCPGRRMRKITSGGRSGGKNTPPIPAGLPDTRIHDAINFALACIAWSHSPREWLLVDRIVDRNSLDQRPGGEPAWRMVRGLVDRSRRPASNRNATDAVRSVSREPAPFSLHPEGCGKPHANLLDGGRKHRLLEAAGVAGAMRGRVPRDVELRVDPLRGTVFACCRHSE